MTNPEFEDQWTRLVSADHFGNGDDRFVRFYEWQTTRWPMLAIARERLQATQMREVEVDGRKVIVQWNPARTTSATAKVDSDSIRARRCFLCPENQPVEEWGLPFGDDLITLANPAPILGTHLVLAHRRHRDQVLTPVLSSLIAMPSAAKGSSTTLYNGRNCGASAPDHLHLQAVVSGQTPLEQTLLESDSLCLAAESSEKIVCHDSLSVWIDRWAGRTAIVLSGLAPKVDTATRSIIAAWTRLVGDSLEGPLNAVAFLHHEGPCVVIFPRAAHRPSCYHQGRLLVSPGALDMAGFFVTIREQDFDRFDASSVEEIFSETSISLGATEYLSQVLRERLKDV